MKSKNMVVARWIAMAALPLILLVILSQVAQQRRVEAATNELFELLAKHIVTHNDPVPIHQVKQLLQRDADVKKRDSQGSNALHHAAFHGPSVIQIILDHGADVNTQNNEGFTPLIGAIINYDSNSVRLLLSKGANPNLHWCIITPQGSRWTRTALSLALGMTRSSMRRSNREVEVPALRAISKMLKAAGAREWEQISVATSTTHPFLYVSIPALLRAAVRVPLCADSPHPTLTRS
jgi:ankyrin repeat protein